MTPPRDMVRAFVVREMIEDKLSKKLLFCTQCGSGAFVMLFVCVDPDFSVASTADAASISHRTYFDEHDVRQAGQATI